jgi:hypothetical protein
MIDDSARYGIARTHFPNVGINENSSLGNIVKVFPNPAMSKVFITSSRSLNETVITLFNIHSQILLQQSPGFGNNFELTIPPDIGTGIYMLRIQSKEGVVTKKIVVGR